MGRAAQPETTKPTAAPATQRVLSARRILRESGSVDQELNIASTALADDRDSFQPP